MQTKDRSLGQNVKKSLSFNYKKRSSKYCQWNYIILKLWYSFNLIYICKGEKVKKNQESLIISIKNLTKHVLEQKYLSSVYLKTYHSNYEKQNLKLIQTNEWKKKWKKPPWNEEKNMKSGDPIYPNWLLVF